jgi:energy-coupling factor transporter ATP-binding protein EcfA2
MRITQLTLCDHIRLRVSKIREIRVNVETDTQLIIGSNGSGKSSLMHEFFPFPPVKSSFGKNGFKMLTLNHNGSEYKLTYEPGEGHAFFKDDVNLNISGINEIQKDLIKEHFGVTNEIHTILKGALPICTMLPSQRKKFLMSMNPIDISVFLEKYQKVHKDVVAYGNNLDMLYSRQKLLMTQRLPEQQFKQMQERKDILENQEKLLLMWLTSVTNELTTITLNNNTSDLVDVKRKIKRIWLSLTKFKNINKIDYRDNLIRYVTQSETLSNEIKLLEGDLEVAITKLNDYEAKKQSIAKDGSNVEEELSNLILKLKDYSFDNNFIPMPKELIDNVNREILAVLLNILVELSYINYSYIASRNELNEIYRKILSINSELDNINKELVRLQAHREEVNKSVKIYGIGSNCEKEKCELLAVYTEHQNSKKDLLSKISEDINQLTTKKDLLTKEHADLSDQYGIQTKLWRQIDIVIDKIHQNSFLKMAFNQDYIVNKIRESPMLIYNELVNYVSQCEIYSNYIETKKRIQELEVLNASVVSKKQLSIEVLENEIIAQTELINKLRATHDQRSNQLRLVSIELNTLKLFSDLKDEINRLSSTITQMESDAANRANHEYLNKLYSILSNILDKVRSELVDITKISKEQELLLVRLDTEVNSIIDELRPKYEKAKEIEKSLFELPIKYTKNFINDIIETTNYFINEIMTYPMHIIPIGENEECDFTFPVMIDNEIPTKDMSSCSEGQKAIIQLAFNLAMVVELKFNDYPIFCDEVDRALDQTHSRKLTEMLLNLIEKRIINQIFVIAHEPSFIEHFTHTGDIIVLNGDNITLPEVFNKNVNIILT